MLESKHHAADGVVDRLSKYVRSLTEYESNKHGWPRFGELLHGVVYRLKLWSTARVDRNLFLWDLERMVAVWASPDRPDWCTGSLADSFARNGEQPELAKQNRELTEAVRNLKEQIAVYADNERRMLEDIEAFKKVVPIVRKVEGQN